MTATENDPDRGPQDEYTPAKLKWGLYELDLRNRHIETWTMTRYGQAMGLSGCYALAASYCLYCRKPGEPTHLDNLTDVWELHTRNIGKLALTDSILVLYKECAKCKRVFKFQVN
jgi:hypothetical protein